MKALPVALDLSAEEKLSVKEKFFFVTKHILYL